MFVCNSCGIKFCFKFSLINQSLTFISVMFGWVFFRADNYAVAWQILRKVFQFEIINFLQQCRDLAVHFSYSSSLLCFAAIGAFFLPNTISVLKFYKYIIYKKRKYFLIFMTSLGLGVLINICLSLMSKPVTFLYYQF